MVKQALRSGVVGLEEGVLCQNGSLFDALDAFVD